MKICKVCLQSDILCGACNRKLEEGRISRMDVALSRALHEINKERNADTDFLCAIEDAGKIFVVVDSRHAARFIGPGGKTIKKISAVLGKQVKLLEKADGGDRHVIEKLIGAPVLGINKVYDGGESYKVRIEVRYARKVRPLSSIVGKILDKKISFVFE